jgi:CRP-like cAMP-binding protein
MNRSSSTNAGNRLLDTLSPAVLARLRPHLEPVELVMGEPIDRADHAIFPIAGMISMVATMEDGDSIEIGIVGREGMYNVSTILGDDRPPENAMVQLPGRAHRMSAHLLRQEMQADGALQKILLRYARATLSAVAQSAACNRLHLLEQRCARWLLASHDRAEADQFAITHEFLAMMLGVRRPGVTLALNALRERGVITYNHGSMTIVDREGLEARSCECYRVIQNEFARLLGA